MSKGMPSMVALLGLLAVAGYRNKDKISEMLSSGNEEDGAGRIPPDRADKRQDQGSRSFLTELGGIFSGNNAAGTLSQGLSDLVDRFKQSGQSEVADSWIKKHYDRKLEHNALAQTLGEDTIGELTAKTGLSRAELLERLAATIPETVDHYSPEGKLPTEEEARRYR